MRKSVIPQEFLQCPRCDIVHFDPILKLSDPSVPAPCCGATGESRGLWVPLPADALLDLVENQDRYADEGRRIAVVFLASALEMLFEHVLVYLLSQHTSSNDLLEATLDSNQGALRRRELFNKLSRQKLGDILAAQGMASFLADWSELVGIRNKVAHGHAYAISSRHDELLQRVENDACQAFAHLYNAVTAQRPAP